MAGVTDSIFRLLCKEQGADVMVTEFVSAEGIFRRNERTLEYLEFDEVERPLGRAALRRRSGASGRGRADGARLEAARLSRSQFRLPGQQGRLEKRRLGAPCAIVRCSNGSQARSCRPSRRIRSPRKSASAGARRRSMPTTTARILENAGVQAIAVHGRTKEQGYSGDADWDVIARVAAAVRIPVIGNGDIAGAQSRRTGWPAAFAGIMIGRAAMSAPWIFREIKHWQRNRRVPPAARARRAVGAHRAGIAGLWSSAREASRTRMASHAHPAHGLLARHAGGEAPAVALLPRRFAAGIRCHRRGKSASPRLRRARANLPPA